MYGHGKKIKCNNEDWGQDFIGEEKTTFRFYCCYCGWKSKILDYDKEEEKDRKEKKKTNRT